MPIAVIMKSFAFVCFLLINTVNCDSTSRVDSPWTYLCLMFHSNEFVFETEVIDNGCKLKCVTLSETIKSFYDSSAAYIYKLKNGIYCDLNRKCVNGECVHYHSADKEDTGIAQITVFDASVPNKDVFSKSDVYVKVRVFGPINVNVGKTATIENNNQPVFNQTFTTPKISKLSSVIFEIVDKDFRFDDFIATVFVSVDESDHRTPLKLEFPGGWIRVKLHWVNKQELNSLFVS